MKHNSSLEQRIYRYLTSETQYGNYIKSIDIERLALENGYKPSTASRCMRKLAEEGKLEKKYVNGAVSYRVSQKIQISQYQNSH